MACAAIQRQAMPGMLVCHDTNNSLSWRHFVASNLDEDIGGRLLAKNFCIINEMRTIYLVIDLLMYSQ